MFWPFHKDPIYRTVFHFMMGETVRIISLLNLLAKLKSLMDKNIDVVLFVAMMKQVQHSAKWSYFRV